MAGVDFLATLFEGLGFHFTRYFIHMGEHITQHGVHGTTRALLTHMLESRQLVLAQATQSRDDAQGQLQLVLSAFTWATDVLTNSDENVIDYNGTELDETEPGIYGVGSEDRATSGGYDGYSYASGFSGSIGDAKLVMAILADTANTTTPSSANKGDIATLVQLMAAWDRTSRAADNAQASLNTTLLSISAL